MTPGLSAELGSAVKGGPDGDFFARGERAAQDAVDVDHRAWFSGSTCSGPRH